MKFERIASRMAFGAPLITPEDISTALETFEYKIGNVALEYGDGYDFGANVTGEFQFRGMSIPISVDIDGSDYGIRDGFEIKEVSASDTRPIEPLHEMDNEDYEDWILTYRDFNWTPIFNIMNEKFGPIIDDEVIQAAEANVNADKDAESERQTHKSLDYWREL